MFKIIIALCLIIKILSTFDDFEKAVLISTKEFVLNLIEETWASCELDCNIDIYLKEIYYNSFQLDNTFGGFQNCLKNTNMTYLYFLLIETNFIDATQKSLADYYRYLIFHHYKSFSMCLPNLIKFIDNITISYNGREDYLLRIYNLKELNENIKDLNPHFSFYIIMSILCIFLTFSVFFSIFPEYQDFLNIFKKKSLSEDIKPSFFLPTEAKKNESGIYKFLSFSFNITKNTDRMFKPTKKIVRLHASYINDSSLSFMNGVKALNLLVITYCLVLWALLVSPTAVVDIYKLESILQIDFFLPVVSILYNSIYFIFGVNSFILSYKFLFHVSNENTSFLENTSLIKKTLTFILPLTYYYFVFIFLILFVYNLPFVFRLFRCRTDGPFLYLFFEFSNKSFKNVIKFILLIANFENNNNYIDKNSLFGYFFKFINGVYYFMITLILLIIYSFKPKIAYTLIFLIYITLFFYSYYCFAKEDRFIKDIFGFDNNNIKILHGASIYLIGAYFGILYFEYNYEALKSESLDITQIDIFTHSVKSVSGIDESFLYTSTGSKIKMIGKSNFYQNLIIMVLLTFLFVMLLYEFTYLVPILRYDPLYKLSVFEKIYVVFKLDLITLLIFALLWKFAIFQTSPVKRILESTIWLPLSRSFFIVCSLLTPITYFTILSINYPISFNNYYVLFLAISTLFILFFISFIINLILEVPMKVGFKKLFGNN